MVLATVRIVPRPGQEEETLRAVRAVADSARALPGCVTGEILREIAPPWALVYSATWLDERRLENHLISDDYDLLLKLVEVSAEPPSVTFRVVSETRDLSWVERLRLGDSAPRSTSPHPPIASPVDLADRRSAGRLRVHRPRPVTKRANGERNGDT